MTKARDVSIYLKPALLAQVHAGKNAFFSMLSMVLEERGLTPSFHEENEAGLLRQAEQPGYSFVERQHPINDRTLCLRSAYFRPFWHIERSPARWLWPVAAAAYTPPKRPTADQLSFFEFWRDRLFPDAGGTGQEGFIFVPLQGRPLVTRSFQSMSPIEMVKSLATHLTHKKIAVTLHPGENYSDDERTAIEALSDEYSNVDLVSDKSAHLLKRCDFVATQNSSLGFHAYFHHKPAIFFGQNDCHHIAASVPRQGLEEALETVERQLQTPPNFASYVHWFWQIQSINAGHADAGEKIHRALDHAGWP